MELSEAQSAVLAKLDTLQPGRLSVPEQCPSNAS
jgi:hypothetical protein